MSYHPNPEQNAVSKAFDNFQAHFVETISNPTVRAELGEIAIELEHIHSSAFVPNLRNGLFVIPKKHKGNDNLAIVPLTEKQADNAYEVTARLDEGEAVRTWGSYSEAATSTRYGLELPDELDSLFREGSPGEANAPSLKGLRSGTLARTTASLNRTSNGTYWVSRPNLLVRRRLLDDSPSENGALIAHETIHVSDLLEDGALYGTLTYGAATELRAYHVGATICKAARLDSALARDSMRIDALREQEIGNTDKPFTPNPLLMSVLQKEGKI